MISEEQKATLYKLETSLHKKEVRNSREHVAALLSDDFLEFGKSGMIFNKESILNLLESEETDLQVEVSDFNIRELAPDVVLVTYKGSMVDDEGKTISSLRSSIWVLQEGNWRMVFHQGTVS